MLLCLLCMLCAALLCTVLLCLLCMMLCATWHAACCSVCLHTVLLGCLGSTPCSLAFILSSSLMRSFSSSAACFAAAAMPVSVIWDTAVQPGATQACICCSSHCCSLASAVQAPAKASTSLTCCWHSVASCLICQLNVTASAKAEGCCQTRRPSKRPGDSSLSLRQGSMVLPADMPALRSTVLPPTCYYMLN